ncbi:uncharacterized protein L201_004902 [Kwoniella dendrophila CBS 6074]|uniref:Fe2OG dioxygenase domain-containing protein n=1 Tax=Kwoniella dendrophila CBS 6074 TaxID=1295534 RepID=A0AAX4JYN3_9TREE
MKRSFDLTSSSTNTVTLPSKRQASLAGFLKPKNDSTIRSPRKVKSDHVSGIGKEDKPIILEDDDEDEVSKQEQEEEELKSISIIDKGKAKAIDTKSTDDDLVEPWPPSGIDHPYHKPPTKDYNHPIVIPPINDELKPIHFNLNPKVIYNPITDLDLVYYKNFIDKNLSSKKIMDFLLDNLPWYRVKYKVRGIDINTPRFTTVFGKDSTQTPWSGYQKCKPRAIPEILERLMRKVEQVTNSQFNFCLVNYYSTGEDSISYHSDSESFLGLNPTIASLTLGYSRDFLLRHVNYKNHPKTGKSVNTEKFNLEDGDMILMKGKTQHEWQHSIPKRSKAKGRINITFRKGIVKYATENYYNYNVGKGNLHKWNREKQLMEEVDSSDGGVKT